MELERDYNAMLIGDESSDVHYANGHIYLIKIPIGDERREKKTQEMISAFIKFRYGILLIFINIYIFYISIQMIRLTGCQTVGVSVIEGHSVSRAFHFI